MAFFTDQETETLRIKKMILHVVGTESFSPATARAVEHETFFRSRIFDLNATPIYSFQDDSTTRTELENMATGKQSFEKGAQSLSRDFSKLHGGATRDGALFIFELSNKEPALRVYCLIKYDYSEAIEQAEKDGTSLLRKIVTAFIADRKAIQKAAIVRVYNGVVESGVATRDRAKPSPDIGEYFAKFLGVTRSLSNVELTERAKHTVRAALQDTQELLSESHAKSFAGAIAILRQRSLIDEDAIIEALTAVAKENLGEPDLLKIRAVTLRKLKHYKLVGVSFRPDKRTFGRPNVHLIKTVENIMITYPDQLGSNSINRQKQPGGGEIITIKTQGITEDAIINK